MSAVALARTGYEAATGTAVTLSGIQKHFGTLPVLNDVSVAIPGGQFLAMVGRSGSGKSTVLRLLSGLDTPSRGSILFDGAPARSAAARIMFQEPRLLPWASVLDNVKVGLRPGLPKALGAAKALDALQAVGLRDRAAEWPTVLSGGQKQRVALARALVSRPSLLLLDEPLGALDALTRIEMQDLIARAWHDQGFTAILVTHDVAEAVRLADRILVLKGGTVSLDVANPAPHPRPVNAADSILLAERILAELLGDGGGS